MKIPKNSHFLVSIFEFHSRLVYNEWEWKKEFGGIDMSVLEIKNLHVSIEDKEILKGVNLTL